MPGRHEAGCHTSLEARRRPWLRAWMLAFAACSAAQADPLAPDGSKTASELMDLQFEQLIDVRISSASGFSQAANHAPAVITLLTAADFRDYGWRTLAEALATVPGLYTKNDRNYTYLGARGFLRPGDLSGRFLLLVDGVRVNDAVYGQASGGQEFLIDPEMIERVEYVPGPGSAVHGSNAFFGVINIITRSAGTLRGLQGSASVASRGGNKQQASYGWQGGDGAQLLLSASRQSSKGDDLFYSEFDTPAQNNGVAEDLDYERAQKLLLKASAGAFSLSYAYSNRSKGIPTASYEQAFNDERSATTDRYHQLTLGYRHTLGASTRLDASLYSGDYQLKALYAYEEGLNIERAHGLWYGGEVQLTTTRWAGQQLLVGVSLKRDARVDQLSYQDDPYVLFQDDHRSRNHASVYVEDEIVLARSLLLNLGGRYDGDSVNGGHFSPRAALIAEPVKGSTVKAIYGTAYRAPNGFELYYDVQAKGGQRANRNLQSERIRSVELVLEQALSAHAQLTASVYDYHVTRLISQTFDEGSGLLEFANRGTANAQGAQLSLDQYWQGGIRVRASTAWQLARDGNGVQLLNSPRHLSKFNVSAPLFGNKLRLGLQGRYTGPLQGQFGRVPSSITADATLQWRSLLPNLDAAISVYNLADRRNSDVGGPEFVQNAIEQDGRTFMFRLSGGF